MSKIGQRVIMLRKTKLCRFPFGVQELFWDSGMEKKRIDDSEPGPVPPTAPLDRFGFVKQEPNNSPDGLAKGRSAYEYERNGFLLLIM